MQKRMQPVSIIWALPGGLWSPLIIDQDLYESFKHGLITLRASLRSEVVQCDPGQDTVQDSVHTAVRSECGFRTCLGNIQTLFVCALDSITQDAC